MARTANSSLSVTIDGNVSPLEAALRQGDAAVKRAADNMNRNAKALDQSMARSSVMSGKFGGAMQQAGFQIGDFAVQVASGQSALVAMTQQGAQLLGAFGPWGAVIGAAGAVVGALATSIIGAGDSAATTEEKLDLMNKSIADVKDSAITSARGLQAIVEQYGELDEQLIHSIQLMNQFNAEHAKINASRGVSAVAEGAAASKVAISEALVPRSGMRGMSQEQKIAYHERGVAVVDRVGALVNRAQSDDLPEQVAALRELRDLAVEAATATEKPNEALITLAETLNSAVLSVEEYEKAMADSAKAQELLARPVKDLAKMVKDLEDEESGSSGRAASAEKRAMKRNDLLDQEIAKLRARHEAYGLSDAALAQHTATMEAAAITQRLLNEIRREGREASPEELAALKAFESTYIDLSVAIDAETRAMQAHKKAAAEAQRRTEEFGRAIVGAISHADSFEDALKRVGLALLEMSMSGLSGEGPLGGVFGNVLGTVLGGVAGSIFGGGQLYSGYSNSSVAGMYASYGAGSMPMRAAGGPLTAGVPALVGERAPEVIVPRVNADVLTMAQAAGVARTGAAAAGDTYMSFSIPIDATGTTDPAATAVIVRRELQTFFRGPEFKRISEMTHIRRGR